MYKSLSGHVLTLQSTHNNVHTRESKRLYYLIFLSVPTGDNSTCIYWDLGGMDTHANAMIVGHSDTISGIQTKNQK